MTRTRTKIIKGLTPALVVAAVAAPSASAEYQDLRSPDAREAALASEARNHVDLRSPDARDAGRVVSSPSPSPAPSSGQDGAAWDDVGIVAGGLLGLVLIGLGGRAIQARRATRTAAVSS